MCCFSCVNLGHFMRDFVVLGLVSSLITQRLADKVSEMTRNCVECYVKP